MDLIKKTPDLQQQEIVQGKPVSNIDADMSKVISCNKLRWRIELKSKNHQIKLPNIFLSSV